MRELNFEEPKAAAGRVEVGCSHTTTTATNADCSKTATTTYEFHTNA